MDRRRPAGILPSWPARTPAVHIVMRVAITRARSGADATAQAVARLGATPVITPLLTVARRAFNSDISNAQAIAFTSANGVRAFVEASRERNVRVFTVGDHTADAARLAGFPEIISADGNVAGLAALAVSKLDPKAGPVLHLSGDHVAGDLVGALTQAGFEAERRVVYESIAATALPEAFAQPLDIVLFHSGRAAEIFVRLGAPGAERLTAACLSPAVAEAAAHVKWAKIVVAPKPREDALLAAALTPQNT